MKRISIIALLIISFWGCKQTQDPKDNAFIIKGKLENANSIVFAIDELAPKDLVPFDSILTDAEGNFAYRNNIEDAGFYIININRANSLTLLIEPGEVIDINGNANNLLNTAEISGSKGSSLMLSLNRKLATSYKILDSLADFYRESRFSPDFDNIRQTMNAEYVNVFESQRDFVKNFIDNNPKSLASIIALNQYLGDRMLLTMSDHFKYFEDLSNSLSNVYPTNKHVIDLKKQISTFKRRRIQLQQAEEQLSIGKKAPEIVMNNLQGQPVSLSSLTGNYVLIDFWAEWCDPCRQNNIKLKEIYKSYKGKGFEIYGISLDRSMNEWTRAIQEDKIDWIQVSDLQFWNSPIVGLYAIDGLPFNLLIDKEGIIIAKGISPKELNEILHEKLE
jgi:peroxiredoxin